LDDGRAWKPQWVAALRALQTQIAAVQRDSVASVAEQVVPQPAVVTAPASESPG
jgi:hypothetical protein